jgi:hypothetical protein
VKATMLLALAALSNRSAREPTGTLTLACQNLDTRAPPWPVVLGCETVLLGPVVAVLVAP